MPKLSDIPLSKIGEVLGGAREGQRRRRACVRVAIELEEGVPAMLATTLREAFVPETSSGLVHVARIDPEAPVRVNPDADVALVVIDEAGGPGTGVARAFASAGVPCALIVESAVEAEEWEGVSVVAAATPEALLDKLAEWLVGSCDNDIALGANFPFTRAAVARACVGAKSAQNAAIALLPIGSGADLPVMAANQVLMALDLAGAYGKAADLSRMAELAFVVVGAVGSRELSRALRRALPGLGSLARPLVAYAGTQLIGLALTARHELGDSVETGSHPGHCPLTNAAL